jgi:CTP synthase (UTP-ammonia lyase)
VSTWFNGILGTRGHGNRQYEAGVMSIQRRTRIGIIGDFNPTFPPHLGTNDGIRHAADALNLAVDIEWIPTELIGSSPEALLAQFAGLWASPGSPYQSHLGKARITL